MHLGSPVNIMVLCNNEIAIPAMQQLFQSRCLKAVVVPENNPSLFSLIRQMLFGTEVTVESVNRTSLEAVVKKIATDKNIAAGWLMTFPYILHKSLLNILPGGFINFHYGLLPQYRGSNPVLAQMLNGEKEGGITVHIIDEKIDNGPIVLQHKLPIDDKDSFGMQLHKLSFLAASLVQPILKLYNLSFTLPSVNQDESKASYYKKPVAADLMINWDVMSSKQIIRLVNACNPWNKGAGAIIKHMGIRIVDAEIEEKMPSQILTPGSIMALDKNEGLKVYCFDNIAIKINVISTNEGFFTGNKLADYGVKISDKFLFSQNFGT